MNCEQALNLISAQLDGELTPDDQAVLEAHLQECAPCRATAEALQAQDADLRRAFAPRRQAATAVAERVIVQLRLRPADAPAPAPAAAAPGKRRFRLPWLPMLLSAAAGFLIAVLIFRPWERRPIPEVPETGPVAKAKDKVRLAVTTGAVEVLPPGKKTWEAVNGGAVVEVGCKVRTPDQVRCEFRCPDDSEVRLNGNTELTFHTGRQLALDRGQILAKVTPGTAFQVQVMDDASVTALGTQFDLARQQDEAVLTVLEGSTQVEIGEAKETVNARERAKITPGRLSKPHEVGVRDLVQATRWIHEILVLKGRDDPDLASRVEDLLAQAGEVKAAYLTEPEIRALGDHCVLPLTRFIQSDRSLKPGLKSRRVEAARILADLAQPWSIPDLIQMLGDADGDVRFYVARGLTRLTTETQGCAPEAWRAEPRPKTKQDWLDWWKENKDRFIMPTK
jgi:ferric-dicitrate binding protein FerR (iron transport regulator)